MSAYQQLRERLDDGEIVILDGAIGTELQEMGAQMGGGFWCARTIEDSPDLVRQLHMDYIDAGADVITTNTFDTPPLAFRNLGMEEEAEQWNTRAVQLALEARDRVGADRPVVVAGSIGPCPTASEDETARSYRDHARYLADSGVDMLIVESPGRRLWPRPAAVAAAVETGLPAWAAMSARMDEGGQPVMLGHPLHIDDPQDQTSEEPDPTFVQGIGGIKLMGCEAALVFHSEVEHTEAALKVLKDNWDGPIVAYPHRGDFKMPDWIFENRISFSEFLESALTWVGAGAQIVGGCCGIGREHIRSLKQELPAHL